MLGFHFLPFLRAFAATTSGAFSSDNFSFLPSLSTRNKGPQWTPPVIQEITIDEYETATRKDMVLLQSRSTPKAEGNSGNPDSAGSTSFHSNSGESESAIRMRLPSYQNFKVTGAAS